MQVRTITALAVAALAEAAAPYGIESFDSVIRPLWTGVREHRHKVLAAFLKGDWLLLFMLLLLKLDVDLVHGDFVCFPFAASRDIVLSEAVFFWFENHFCPFFLFKRI